MKPCRQYVFNIICRPKINSLLKIIRSQILDFLKHDFLLNQPLLLIYFSLLLVYHYLHLLAHFLIITTDVLLDHIFYLDLLTLGHCNLLDFLPIFALITQGWDVVIGMSEILVTCLYLNLVWWLFFELSASSDSSLLDVLTLSSTGLFATYLSFNYIKFLFDHLINESLLQFLGGIKILSQIFLKEHLFRLNQTLRLV